MKEKERKLLLLNKDKEKIEELRSKLVPPKKDISMLKAFHALQRMPLVEEFIEDLLGEYHSLLIRLERYGETSKIREKSIFTYSKNSSTESKRPSTAWLHSKVKRYESQTTI